MPEVNALLEEQLPADEWIYLKDAQHDLSGLLFAGKLQHACHYPDIRSLPKQEFQACAKDLQATLALGQNAYVPANMADYDKQRFGEVVTQSR